MRASKPLAAKLPLDSDLDVILKNTLVIMTSLAVENYIASDDRTEEVCGLQEG